ncbi:PIN domain-containing protein [Candidatus Saccharibacteria bacterium]|nr:MAG: PIN domain-containing protein [Candidatus Saccharibacteria bacterium]
MQDVPAQAAQVERLLQSSAPNCLELTSVTVAELTYVLRTMAYDHAQIAGVMTGLCSFESVRQFSPVDARALEIFSNTVLDYEDCFLIAQALVENGDIASFDKKLLKTFEKLQLAE